MLLTRRELLAAGTVAAATPALQACRAAPAIIAGEITPQQFGAKGGDPVADTLGWNRALAEAARQRRPVLAKGSFVLRVPPRPLWNWRRRLDAGAHVAVQMPSHTQIQGVGCEILVGAPPPGVDGHLVRHMLFGTAASTAPGATTDISLEGLVFDFREEFGPLHPFTYAVSVVGVDRFTRRDLVIRSTGAQGGRGLHSENVRGRLDEKLRHENIVQGIYVRYEQGVRMRDIAFDTFNEALDFDGPCDDVELRDLRFRNGLKEAQCIDTGGGRNWVVDGVSADNTGPVAYIYSKAVSQPRYEDWLASLDEGGVARPLERAVFRNVTARRANGRGARKGEALRVGTYRNPHQRKRQGEDLPSPADITIENWTLANSGQIAVNDCRNLVLRHVRMTDPVVPAGDDPDATAALVLRDAPIDAGGAVTGTVADVTIVNPPPGGAVNLVAGAGLSVSDVTVTGARGTRPVRVRPREGAGDRPRLARLRVDGRAVD
jgi:hypothetical protein